jgi:hypothetical protein
MLKNLDLADSPVNVIRAGGLHTAGCAIFDETFEKALRKVYPQAVTQVLDISPVYGAVIHAAHSHFGQIPPTFLSNLFEQARAKGDL